MQKDASDSAGGLIWPGALVACLLWSSAFAVIKIGLRHVDPLTFAAVRFILAGALLIPLCRSAAALPRALATHGRLILAVGLLQTTVLYGTFFWGMNLVGGAQGAVVLGSGPLISAVLAHLLMHDDRMTLRKTGAILLGMVGVVIIALASKPWSPAGATELLGISLLLGGQVASTLANILVARNRKPISPFVLNSAQMILGGAVLLVISLFVHDPPTAVPPAEFFVALIWLAAVSAAGFSIWYTLLRREKVSRLNMWKFLMPVFGAALSWLLLPDESPDVSTVVGMLCVAVAVLAAHFQDARAGGR